MPDSDGYPKIVTDNFISEGVPINLGYNPSNSHYSLAFQVEPAHAIDWHFVDIWITEDQLKNFIEHAQHIIKFNNKYAHNKPIN